MGSRISPTPRVACHDGSGAGSRDVDFVPSGGRRKNVTVSRSYQYIESRCAYGEFGNGVFDRMVESRREIWIGMDRSGLIRSARIGWGFFNDEQRTRWETTPHPEAIEDLSPAIDLFAPGCLGGQAFTGAELPTDRSELASALAQQRRLSLHRIGELMGEALLPVQLREALYEVAAALPGAELLANAGDELGRTGPGVARTERGVREELIFEPDSGELLARREVMVDPAADFAPPGAVVGWTCYLSRQHVDGLPEGIPPIPGPPCSPPGAGRGTVIERGFLLSTGYFTDLGPHLENWHTSGIISDAQYDALKRSS
jgi:hypothetical protein